MGGDSGSGGGGSGGRFQTLMLQNVIGLLVVGVVVVIVVALTRDEWILPVAIGLVIAGAVGWFLCLRLKTHLVRMVPPGFNWFRLLNASRRRRITKVEVMTDNNPDHDKTYATPMEPNDPADVTHGKLSGQPVHVIDATVDYDDGLGTPVQQAPIRLALTAPGGAPNGVEETEVTLSDVVGNPAMPGLRIVARYKDGMGNPQQDQHQLP